MGTPSDLRMALARLKKRVGDENPRRLIRAARLLAFIDSKANDYVMTRYPNTELHHCSSCGGDWAGEVEFSIPVGEVVDDDPRSEVTRRLKSLDDGAFVICTGCGRDEILSYDDIVGTIRSRVRAGQRLELEGSISPFFLQTAAPKTPQDFSAIILRGCATISKLARLLGE